MRKKTIVAATILLVAGLFILPKILDGYRAPRFQASLVRISFLGYSTNDAAQRFVTYRVQNDNPGSLLALAEFTNSPPGSGVFVRLHGSQPETALLPTPLVGSSNQVQVSCFVEDRGLLTWAYGRVEKFRGGQPHEVTKLLFTVSGPPVEP